MSEPQPLGAALSGEAAQPPTASGHRVVARAHWIPGGAVDCLFSVSRSCLPSSSRESEAAAVAAIQERLDLLGGALSALEARAAEGKRWVEAVEAAAAEWAVFDALSPIPDDPKKELDAHGRATAERDAQLARIEQEREAARLRVEGGRELVLQRDRVFWAGLGTGSVALATGIASPWPIVALLGIPAFGLAALRGLSWVGWRQLVSSGERKELLFREREARVGERWLQETETARQWMVLAGVEEPGQLVERIASRQRARMGLESARRRLEAWSGEPANQRFDEERAALQEEIRVVEEELRGATAAALSAGHSTDEMGWLGTDPLATGPSADESGWLGADPLATGPSTDESGWLGMDPLATGPAMEMPGWPGSAGLPVAEPREAEADALVELLQRISSWSGLDLGGCAERILPRAGEFLAYLSAGRWHGIGLSETAGTTLYEGSHPREFSTVEASAQDWAWVCVHLAFVEAFGPLCQADFRLDDPFGHLEGSVKERLGVLLQGVGRSTRILHHTDDPIWIQWSDGAAGAIP